MENANPSSRQTYPLRLLAATRNRGKVRELRELLAGPLIELSGLDEFEGIHEVEETGSTFYENAVLKASNYARQAGIWTLADDSGLEVAALGGAPGVHSARFAGESAGYDTKIAELLRLIEGTGSRDRRARFVCVMAVADDKGEIRCTTEGVCKGKIAESPRGSLGFGYDPIFVPEGFERTFGELSGDIKQQISHRARASAEIMRYLRDFIGV